jgi:hypothetical protein
MSEIWWGVIALVIYSGPLFPLLGTFLFKKRSAEHFKRNLRLLIVLMGQQVLSFAPYFLAVIFGNQDALHALFFPAALGLLLFAGTLIYFACECYYFFYGIRKNQ